MSKNGGQEGKVGHNGHGDGKHSHQNSHHFFFLIWRLSLSNNLDVLRDKLFTEIAGKGQDLEDEVYIFVKIPTSTQHHLKTILTVVQ